MFCKLGTYTLLSMLITLPKMNFVAGNGAKHEIPDNVAQFYCPVSSCLQVIFFFTVPLMSVSAGKVLIIGGGIANFTNVAATFKVSMEHSHQGSDLGTRLDSSHIRRPNLPSTNRSCRTRISCSHSALLH